MGKRSTFERRAHDAYSTPYKPVLPLIPFLRAARIKTFAEPCVGDYALHYWLRYRGFRCVQHSDIRFGTDALTLDASAFAMADAIITNPPWSRELLHPLIDHFMRIKQTWLLFDADWAHTHQAKPFLGHCSLIVSVGRVRWIAGTKATGKDNCAWYRFDIRHRSGPRFVGQ